MTGMRIDKDVADVLTDGGVQLNEIGTCSISARFSRPLPGAYFSVSPYDTIPWGDRSYFCIPGWRYLPFYR
jgi:hypothetical protein